MTRYTMRARSQGNAPMQRTMAALERDDVRNPAPRVESAVRTWPVTRLNGFYCDLQSVYAPPLHATARGTLHPAKHMHDTGKER